MSASVKEQTELTTKKEIDEALTRQSVFASVPDLGERFCVRDVREVKDNSLSRKVLQVKLLEGWRTPSRVWIEA